MMLGHFFLLAIASLAPSAYSQDVDLNSAHNVTAITGSWATGAKNVRTGPGFVNPVNRTFNYPKTTGIGVSFTDDGFYEISRYRFIGNGSEPTCIVGVVGWAHGRYSLNSNGSATLTPFGDGFQQIQDPCAAVSNFIEDYNVTEFYKDWRIFQDPRDGFKLHLFAFDGAPLPPMFQISTTPEMLPTRALREPPPTATGNGVKPPTRRSILERKSNDSPVKYHIALGATVLLATVSFAATLL